MQNLKYDTDKVIYETETDSQTQRDKNESLGLEDTNYSIENKVLLYSTGNYIQQPKINPNGKYEKEYIHE